MVLFIGPIINSVVLVQKGIVVFVRIVVEVAILFVVFMVVGNVFRKTFFDEVSIEEENPEKHYVPARHQNGTVQHDRSGVEVTDSRCAFSWVFRSVPKDRRSMGGTGSVHIRIRGKPGGRRGESQGIEFK